LSFSILIVDDSAQIRRQLRSCLQQNSSWKVCGEAVDGRDAIHKAEELKPDLIVLDLSMPVMNGFEAARKLKEIRPQVPLLMFATFKTTVLEEEAAAVRVRRGIIEIGIEFSAGACRQRFASGRKLAATCLRQTQSGFSCRNNLPFFAS